MVEDGCAVPMDSSFAGGTGGSGRESVPPVPNITSKTLTAPFGSGSKSATSQSPDHVGVGSGRLFHVDVSQVIEALDHEREHLDRQIKSIAKRKAEIDTTISVLQGMRNKLAPSEQPDPVSQVDQVALDEPSDERVLSHPGRDGPQNLLRRLMHERPGVELDSKAAHALLIEEGWESTSKDPINVVRSALAVLASLGDIAKRGRGRYVYDADQQEQVVTGEQPDLPGATGELDLMASANGSRSAGAVYSPVSTYAAVSDRGPYESLAARPPIDGERTE